ncbi:MAG: hypothetical protein IT308_06630, partial [Anaerolineaceae bacterium]|nr:hypothetical protein [Anaerolineaceae bacterium]
NAAGVRSAGMVSKPLGRAGRVDPLEGRPEPTYHSLGAEVEASRPESGAGYRKF